jgi:cell division protein FtsB
MRFIKYDYIKHILIILIALLLVCSVIISNNKYNELKESNNVLEVTVNNQTATIDKLTEENNNLKEYISQLEEKIAEQEQKNNVYSTKTVTVSNRDFKSYMSYKAITDRSSMQWQLQQQAYTDGNGIRCIDGRPMVAVGTGWGLVVGDVALVTCDNGNSFEVIVGDIKADAHTFSDNKTGAANGCRCEFIVDSSVLNNTVKAMGNVAVLEAYNGYVTNITKR